MTTPRTRPSPSAPAQRPARTSPPRPAALAAMAPRAAPAPSSSWPTVSEFQPDIHDATYLRWSKAIVIRALYGTRVDRAWYGGARRDALHAGGARFVGIYAYITGQDVTAQAKALISLLGKLRPGEKVIADIEEGPGNQQARWVTWAKAINAALHDPPWDYSGLNYAATHGLQPVTWVAAYGSHEPSPPHKLWQFTDRYSVPGVGTCDCSVFHGTIDQLAALAYQGARKPVPAGPHRHTAPGGRTLAQIAHARNTTPAHIQQVTAGALTPADVTVNAGLALPAGFVYYTSNP